MDDRADTVKQFFESMKRRDWSSAAAYLAPGAEIWWPATGERFRGSGFIAMNRAYPEGWSIEVVETLACDQRVAARVRVTQGESVHWCAGFYTVRDGLITGGVECWVTEAAEQPPAWRAEFVQ